MFSRVAILIAVIFLAACAENEAEMGAGTDDMRAVYSGADGMFEITMELSADGALRAEVKGQDMWALQHGNKGYFIIPKGDDTQVIDAQMASELMREVMPDDFGPTPEVLEEMTLNFSPLGKTEINGRSGTAYGPSKLKDLGRAPLVMSDDPALQRLGKAMRTNFEFSASINPIKAPMTAELLAILAKGAPIRFMGADLRSIEALDIEDSRFKLPSQPLDRNAARELMIERNLIPREKMKMPTREEAMRQLKKIQEEKKAKEVAEAE